MSVRIPVLMYHEVAKKSEREPLRRRTHPDYVLPEAVFAQQMLYLADHDYHCLTACEVARAVTGQNLELLPERPIVITFDDGFAGNFEYALPILLQHNLKAAFFVTVNEIGTADMMSWEQLAGMVRAGMEIHSHLMHHVMMSELSRAEAFLELRQSREALQGHLAIPVDMLSLPNGSSHAHYVELARDAGYIGGFSSRLGYVSRDSNPFLLERVPVLRSTSYERFAGMVGARRGILAGAQMRRQVYHLLSALVSESVINRWYHKVNRIGMPHPSDR
jgi:peptidoglycan/xylan/chitin deacetylase (PgdA/CDA1 family)